MCYLYNTCPIWTCRAAPCSTPAWAASGGGGEGGGQWTWQLRGPSGVAAAPDGRIPVADVADDRIPAFRPNGAFDLAIGSYGRALSQLRGPSGVAAAPDGRIFVADTSNHRIPAFRPNGAFDLAFGSRGGGLGQLFPSGAAVALAPPPVDPIDPADTLSNTTIALAPPPVDPNPASPPVALGTARVIVVEPGSGDAPHNFTSAGDAAYLVTGVTCLAGPGGLRWTTRR